MAEPQPRFRVPVWTYTYASDQFSGDITLYSPQKELPQEENQGLLLRQVNSDAANKSWIANKPSQFKRCEDDDAEQEFDDAHGILLQDGLAKPLGQQEKDDSKTVRYSRGDRIWVERSLDPRSTIGDEIPVINLDTKEAFMIPYKLICFIPLLNWTGDLDDPDNVPLLAVPVGPVLKYYPGEKNMAQLFFVWPAEEPMKMSYKWDKWDRGRGRNHYPRMFADYSNLTIMLERRQIFDMQWEKLSRKLGVAYPRHVPGRDQTPRLAARSGPIEISDSSSNESSAGLDTYWSPGSINNSNCCNLAPECTLSLAKGVDLVASFIGGPREVEHYHVQDSDADECPEGASHHGHCVLRNNRSMCVFSRDTIDHTCCKLRTNPVLPGPHAAPEDKAALIWETTAGDDHFLNISGNVKTRGELADRDRVPAMVRVLEEQNKRQKREEHQRHHDRHMEQNQQMRTSPGGMPQQFKLQTPSLTPETERSQSRNTTAAGGGHQPGIPLNQEYQDEHRGKNILPSTLSLGLPIQELMRPSSPDPRQTFMVHQTQHTPMIQDRHILTPTTRRRDQNTNQVATSPPTYQPEPRSQHSLRESAVEQARQALTPERRRHDETPASTLYLQQAASRESLQQAIRAQAMHLPIGSVGQYTPRAVMPGQQGHDMVSSLFSISGQYQPHENVQAVTEQQAINAGDVTHQMASFPPQASTAHGVPNMGYYNQNGGPGMGGSERPIISSDPSRRSGQPSPFTEEPPPEQRPSHDSRLQL